MDAVAEKKIICQKSRFPVNLGADFFLEVNPQKETTFPRAQCG